MTSRSEDKWTPKETALFEDVSLKILQQEFDVDRGASRLTRATRDGGIDAEVVQLIDLQLRDRRRGVMEAKLRGTDGSGSADVSIVRDVFFPAYFRDAGAIFLSTNARFTEDAWREAAAIDRSGLEVNLIDGGHLREFNCLESKSLPAEFVERVLHSISLRPFRPAVPGGPSFRWPKETERRTELATACRQQMYSARRRFLVEDTPVTQGIVPGRAAKLSQTVAVVSQNGSGMMIVEGNEGIGKSFFLRGIERGLAESDTSVHLIDLHSPRSKVPGKRRPTARRLPTQERQLFLALAKAMTGLDHEWLFELQDLREPFREFVSRRYPGLAAEIVTAMTSIFAGSLENFDDADVLDHSLSEYLRLLASRSISACILLANVSCATADTLGFLTQAVTLLSSKAMFIVELPAASNDDSEEIKALRKVMLYEGATRVMLEPLSNSDAEAFIRERLPNADTVDLIRRFGTNPQCLESVCAVGVGDTAGIEPGEKCETIASVHARRALGSTPLLAEAAVTASLIGGVVTDLELSVVAEKSVARWQLDLLVSTGVFRRVRDEKAIEFDSAAMQRAIERQLPNDLRVNVASKLLVSGIDRFDGHRLAILDAAQHWEELLSEALARAEHEGRRRNWTAANAALRFAARAAGHVGTLHGVSAEGIVRVKASEVRTLDHWIGMGKPLDEALAESLRSRLVEKTFDGSDELKEIGVTAILSLWRDAFLKEDLENAERHAKDALSRVTGASSISPQSLLDAHLALAFTLRALGHPEEAIALLQSASVSGVPRAELDAHVYSIEGARALYDPAGDSVEYYQHAVELFANLPRSAVAYARTLVDLSIAYFVRGNWEEAERRAEQARQVSSVSSLPVEEARATNMVAAARWVGGGERERGEALQIWTSLFRELSSTTMSERVSRRVLWRFEANLATAAAADQNALVAGERAAAAAAQIIRSRQKLLAAAPPDGYRRERWYAALVACGVVLIESRQQKQPDEISTAMMRTTYARDLTQVRSRVFPAGMFGEAAYKRTGRLWITS